MSTENQLEAHYENVNPQAAFVLCVMGLIVSVVLFAGWGIAFLFSIDQESEYHVKIRNRNFFYVQLLPFASLFLVAMGMLTSYSVQLKKRDSMDYQGPMRVTNVTYEDYVEETGLKMKNYDSFARARYHLDWGYDWACPGHPPCTKSSLTACDSHMCDESKCNADQKEDAFRRTVECAILTFDPNQEYTTYDPLVGPSQDIDWPSIVAFGDCKSCEVAWSVASPEDLEVSRVSGLFLLAVAAFPLGCILYTLYKEKQETSEVSQENNPEAEQQQVETSVIPFAQILRDTQIPECDPREDEFQPKPERVESSNAVSDANQQPMSRQTPGDTSQCSSST